MRLHQLLENIQSSSDLRACASILIKAIAEQLAKEITYEYTKEVAARAITDPGHKALLIQNIAENIDDIACSASIWTPDVQISGISSEFKEFIDNSRIFIQPYSDGSDDGGKIGGRWVSKRNKSIGNDHNQIIINLFHELPGFIQDITPLILKHDVAEINRACHKFYNVYTMVMQHELQHAYDDYRSDGKYYDRRTSGVDFSKEHNEPTYFRSKHEISAHYATAINELYDFVQDIDGVDKNTAKRCLITFRTLMGGYNHLSPTMKQKVDKRAMVEIMNMLGEVSSENT